MAEWTGAAITTPRVKGMFNDTLANFVCLSLCAYSCGTFAHGSIPWEHSSLQWSTTEIEDAFTLGDSAKRAIIDGKECLIGHSILLKVRDKIAFNIDETVWLHAESRSTDVALTVAYDGHEGVGGTFLGSAVTKTVGGLRGRRGSWHKLSVPLERARFANLGAFGSDVIISSDHSGGEPREFTVCSIVLSRSYATSVVDTLGELAIEVVDENADPTPARVGIYDSRGRLSMPSNAAATVLTLGGKSNVITLGQSSTWPMNNRSVFYTDGSYSARLPVGDYEIVVGKGPEYRLARQRFSIRPNQGLFLKLTLRRWVDMAAKGWYSGEDHIHHTRASEEDDQSLALFARAEDLKVSNILQMGNVAGTHFQQRDWNPIATENGSYLLVPGQEDPRTSRRGHTIQLNIRKPLRNPARYLLYHEVTQQVRASGGLTGYAHVVDLSMLSDVSEAAITGMAIDMPFGLVDFAEIMSGPYASSAVWFDFLNLGYKLTPTAGSDYPFLDIPGAVRNYVRIGAPFTSQSWFDGLKNGQTFVSSGPMIEFSINGQGMGSEVHVTNAMPLVIEAIASINPDVDGLLSLELIEQGSVVKASSSQTGASELKLQYRAPARHGTWFVLSARGRKAHVVAYSAPIYVSVDGQTFWKPAEVPAIAARLKKKMREFLEARRPERTESWETEQVENRYRDAQQPLLRERIGQANAMYDDLAKRAASSIEAN